MENYNSSKITEITEITAFKEQEVNTLKEIEKLMELAETNEHVHVLQLDFNLEEARRQTYGYTYDFIKYI